MHVPRTTEDQLTAGGAAHPGDGGGRGRLSQGRDGGGTWTGRRGAVQPPGEGGPEVGLWGQVQPVDAWPGEGVPGSLGTAAGVSRHTRSPAAPGAAQQPVVLAARGQSGSDGQVRRRRSGPAVGDRNPVSPPWPCLPRAPSVTPGRSSRAAPTPTRPCGRCHCGGPRVPRARGPRSVCGQPRVPLPPPASALRTPQRLRPWCPVSCHDAGRGGWRRPPGLLLGPAPGLTAGWVVSHLHGRPGLRLTTRVAGPRADASPRWGRFRRWRASRDGADGPRGPRRPAEHYPK